MLAALRAVRMCSDQSSLLAASIGGATAHIYPCAQVHVRVLYVLPGLRPVYIVDYVLASTC